MKSKVISNDRWAAAKHKTGDGLGTRFVFYGECGLVWHKLELSGGGDMSIFMSFQYEYITTNITLCHSVQEPDCKARR